MLTTDNTNPDLHIKQANGQNKAYIVLSDEELAKGFIRPVRQDYIHNNCNVMTTMNHKIAEVYAHDPKFYSHTFCIHCHAHFPVNEFRWVDSEDIVGS